MTTQTSVLSRSPGPPLYILYVIYVKLWKILCMLKLKILCQPGVEPYVEHWDIYQTLNNLTTDE